jgi:tellurite resistance protein TerC
MQCGSDAKVFGLNIMEHSIWLWVGFGAFILLMLSLDLGLFNRRAHAVTYKEAGIWSAVWISLAALFATLVFYRFGTQRGLEFVTGYLIELSLSVDNLFVFILIFAYFKVPQKYQHRVLFWGVMGALLMRIAMILVGAELIERFHWINYFFGAFLIYTGLKMLRGDENELDPEGSAAVRLVTRYVPISRKFEGEKFFTVEGGRRTGTLLLLVLVVVEITDLVFAVDSIPAIFAVTTDRFILYTSNVFAILGLRSLFFLLAGVIEKFHYLKIGLAIVLAFIGVKMLLNELGMHISIGFSLGIVALVLGGSVLASMFRPAVVTKLAESGPGFETDSVGKTVSRLAVDTKLDRSDEKT